MTDTNPDMSYTTVNTTAASAEEGGTSGRAVHFEPHTIIVLCGPTMCGKSTLVHELRKACPSGLVVLSSDDNRRALLNTDNAEITHRHSPQMAAASSAAFKMLDADLDAYTSYPNNKPYIVVDTTAFSDSFRTQILSLAQDRGYNTAIITFEYKDQKEYTLYSSDDERPVVLSSVKRFMQKVLPTIRAKDWRQRIRITRRGQYPTFFFTSPSLLELETTVEYPAGSALAVIGDSHECVQELSELVQTVASQYGDDTTFVHVGDYLDKGGDTRGMVELMLDLAHTGQHAIVKGNHESYVYNRLMGNITPNPELEKTYFTSLAVLQNDEALRGKFIELFEEWSYDFVVAKSPGARDVIVTHAPCQTRFLGKYSLSAKKAQRNYYVKDRSKSLREELGFVREEAESSHPLHVFGHVAHNGKSLLYKNKVFLDTGAVHGGNLTAVVIRDDRYSFESVPCRKRIEPGVEELPTDLTNADVRKFDIKDYDLGPQEQRLLRQVVSNDIKYISGTMAPAPSTDTELEPLSSALDYFARKGVKEVVLQPKYMGSRCQMYLFRDPGKQSFCVSRSGWRIRNVDQAALEDLLADWTSKVFANTDAQSIVLDGELLPWRALGAGLIDKQFTPYYHVVMDELSCLAGDEFFQSTRLGKDFDPKARLADAQAYKETLDIYAVEEKMSFKPFDILLVDGVRPHLDALEAFTTFNDDPALRVRLDSQEDREEAQGFYNSLVVGKRMEGVVVKPLGETPGVVPYMKVRNSDYLRLVYGYDYTSRLDNLIRQKNISGKAAVSVREHALATEMLTADTDKKQELVVKLIAEFKKEASFDPRL